ncbi:MAG: class I SAM-dependent methyltransferase [Anaerolineales bacterium]|nr:class I SAM-dependent methyltransferase [Anaerolineales bacterium]
MQPIVFEHYRDYIFKKFPPPGKRILEIGALPDTSQTLLSIFVSWGNDYELIGIDLCAPENPPERLPFRLLRCNANDMSIFSDSYFDAVIAVGVFNNDRYFWRSLAEIRRVLRSEGLFYVHVPGFERGEYKLKFKKLLYRIGYKFRIFGLDRPFIYLAENTWLSAVATYHYSPTPQDYYRFSEVAVKEVVMGGFEIIHYEQLLYPPRIIAVGKKAGP